MTKVFQAFRRDIAAATAIEYGMIAALMAAVLVASLGLIGSRLTTKFFQVVSNVLS